MECSRIQEAISATLDGEDPGVDAGVVAAHVVACTPCRRYQAGAAALHRQVRVRAAEPVPDLAEAILRDAAPVAPEPAAAAPTRDWARYVLLAIAATQMVIALPALVMGDQLGATVHVARELGGWDVALAVAWLVVAWAPRRAAGLLPFAAALAVVMGVTATLDIVDGRAVPWNESQHVLDLVGLSMIWLLARSTPSDTPLIPRRHAPARHMRVQGTS